MLPFGNIATGNKQPFVLIAGPCAIESRDMVMHTAEELCKVCDDLNIPLIFKSSFDKANRTSMSARGVGMEEGLRILWEVKEQFCLPVLTDVHETWQCEPVAEVADVLQIPAFLSRQTDLLLSACKTGRYVNVKKGQFMAPWDVKGIVQKVRFATEGNAHAKKGTQAPLLAKEGTHEEKSPTLLLTERGTSFGYGRLVVDMTSLVLMREAGCPIIFDATHSVQQPSDPTGKTGGNRKLVLPLLKAALAVGVDGLFLEVHPDPDNAISDAANQLPLNNIRQVLQIAKQFDELNI